MAIVVIVLLGFITGSLIFSFFSVEREGLCGMEGQRENGRRLEEEEEDGSNLIQPSRD